MTIVLGKRTSALDDYYRLYYRTFFLGGYRVVALGSDNQLASKDADSVHRPTTFIDELNNRFDTLLNFAQISDSRIISTAQTVLVLSLFQCTFFVLAMTADVVGRGRILVPHVIAMFTIIIIALGPALLIRSGRVLSAAWTLCITVSASVFLIVLNGAGSYSTAAPLLVLPVLWARLILDVRGASLVSALTLCTVLFVAWWTSAGFIYAETARFGTLPSAFSVGVGMMLLIISAAFSGYVALQNNLAHQDRMMKMREAAKDANRAKSEFIASIAHEVRTPLAGVMGMVDLLSRENLNSNQTEMAVTARSSARNLMNLINDLLDLSKIELGELRLLPEPVDVVSLFAETIVEYRLAAREKGIEFTTEMPQTECWLLIDPVRFRQIMSNFLSNAVKFTEEGYVRATLRLDERDDGQVNLTLTVEDSGPGIPESMRRRIFGRFIQVDAVQRAEHNGSGLGLAIVSDLARLNGGTLRLDSEEGKGTAFTFEATFKRAKPIALPTPKANGTGPVPTILVVDDSIGNRRVLTRVLQGLGYRTLSAQNGSDAVVSLMNEHVDLVLLDYKMPVKNGAETLKDIRALPEPGKRNVPVIGMSADTAEEELSSWIEAGAEGFMQKPVDFGVLDNNIRRVLQTYRPETPEDQRKTAS